MNYYEYSENNTRNNSNYVTPLEGLSRGSMKKDVYLGYKNFVPTPLEQTFDNELKAVRFAILDLNLYLDLNPNDLETKDLIDNYLNYYQQLLNNVPSGVAY